MAVASPEPSQAQSFLKMRPLSGRERALLLVLFVILYGVGFYFLVYAPFTERVSALQKTLDEKQGQLETAMAIFHRLDDINSRIAVLTTEMERLDRLVPGDNRAAQFLYSCGQWERQTGAKVRSMAFSPATTTEGYEEYVVQFMVVGTYSAQVNFLASLEGMGRLVRVDSVTVVPNDTTAGGGGTVPPSGEGGTEAGGEGTTPPPTGPTYPTTDATTAKYVVHLFVDPSKAAAAAAEEPGQGLTFTLSEGRANPFRP